MKRLLLILLSLTIVIGCFSGVGLAEDAGTQQDCVLYIPMDDRPFNDERMQLMAQSLEIQLIMPDKVFYDTTLDGQSEEGYSCGDRAALMEWLMEHQDSADTLVLALDQLLSGGLLNSRCVSEMTSITLSDGTTMSEQDVIDYIAGLAETKTVYILDSVFRLASSFGIAGYTITDYTITRLYGLVDRPVLTGADLTVENIIDNYRFAADGTEAYLSAGLTEEQLAYFLGSQQSGEGDEETNEDIGGETGEGNGEEIGGETTSEDAIQASMVPEIADNAELIDEAEAVWSYLQRIEPEAAMTLTTDSEEGTGENTGEGTDENTGETTEDETGESNGEITQEPGTLTEAPDSLLANYLSVRQRKLRLTAYALETLTPLDGVHYILGVDDSADGEHIQSNEIRFFETYMDEDDQMFSALDGLGQLALAKHYQDQVNADAAGLQITYYGDCKHAVNAFNYKSNQENAGQLLRYFACTEVSENPDISVIMFSGDTDEYVRKANLAKVISQLNENEADGIPTILIDVTNGTDALMASLPMDTVHLGMLLSYSGRTENPGQVHMALNQGLARYFSLKTGGSLSQEAQTAHLQNLLSALTEEVYDTGVMNVNMYEYISLLGQSDPLQNVTPELLANILEELNLQMDMHATALTDNLENSNFILSLAPYTLGGITGAEISNVRYPWLRQFEIWCDFTCTYAETAHEVGTIHRWSINGVSWTEFKPYDLLTREQAAKVLMMFSQKKVSGDEVCPFKDVADWAMAYVAAAYELGYVNGCDDGTFQGSRNMTRAEFAALMVQYLQAEGIVLEKIQESSFVDLARTGAWYCDAVFTLADAGIIKGFGDGTFRPMAEISRAEAVALFVRMFGRTEQLPESLMTLQRYVDVVPGYWAYGEIQEASISHFCKE